MILYVSSLGLVLGQREMTAQNPRQAFVVNDVFVDPVRCEITRKGQPSEEAPLRAIQILQCLIEKEGELVTYEDLELQIWKGPTSESALYQQVAHLRKALGDDPNHPTFIRTVQKQGYQFIGNLLYTEKSKNPYRRASTQKRNPIPIRLIFASLIVFACTYWYISSHANEHLFQKLANDLSYPTTFAFLSSTKATDNTKYPGLLSSLELIIEYHLDQSPNRHITHIPELADSASYDSVMQHFSEYGKVEFTFTPSWIEKDGKLEITLNIANAITQNIIRQINISTSSDELASSLPQFERKLINELQNLQLISNDQQAALNYNETSNQAIIDSASVLAKTDPNFAELQKAISDAQIAIENNPASLIAYSMLLEEVMLLTNTFIGRYDVDSLMEMFKLRTEQVLKLNPDYYRNYHARAEYECWIQNYDQCASYLEHAIKLKPYNPRVLNLLAWNLIRHNHSPLPIYQLNYDINPFGVNILRYYRNSLIDNNKTTKLAKVLTTHASWNTKPKDWIADSQIETQYSNLEMFSKWYIENYSYIDINEKPDAINKLPSRYIGYMLLNANQPELAIYWLEHGHEQQLPYFELRIVDLISDIWQGNWKPEKWRVAGVFAEDRRQFQTSHDKINIAYFHYYTGLYNYSEKYLLEVFPYFANDEIEINQDNFRYAVYYSEATKHQLKYKQAKTVNQAIKEYLRSMDTSQEKNIGFAMAEAEFYALNGDREKALNIIETAVKDQGWLPNAFLLWPPLEHNPSFFNLGNYPKFKELNLYVNQKLAALCFSKDCS